MIKKWTPSLDGVDRCDVMVPFRVSAEDIVKAMFLCDKPTAKMRSKVAMMAVVREELSRHATTRLCYFGDGVDGTVENRIRWDLCADAVRTAFPSAVSPISAFSAYVTMET